MEDSIEHIDPPDACGNPCYERSLLQPAALSQWEGLPLGWLEAQPHAVAADLTTERNVLVMIDSGATRADFLFGKRSMSCEFTAGSIGFFAVGTELKRSHWRWAQARRMFLDLDAVLPAGPGLVDPFLQLPRHSQLEFRDHELAAVLRSMAREVAAGSPNGRLFAESLSLGVALRLHQRAHARYGGSRERGRLGTAQVQRVEQLVRTRLHENIALSELAEVTGYSPAQFVRLFKNTLGCTPHQYVLRCRLESARTLVLAGTLPLAGIASQTGFASQSHMTAAFVRAFQVPPGEMRRRARGAELQEP